MEKFIEILNDLITDKNKSLRQIAFESNVSAIQYSKYLRGISRPTIDVVVRICDYFECSVDYLFGLIDEDNYKGDKGYNLAKFVSRYVGLLKSNKITHWKFCKLNNLSESCLRHWKYGDVPKIESLIIIATNLSTSIDYLIGRTDTY